jgi:hypothetical protein
MGRIASYTAFALGVARLTQESIEAKDEELTRERSGSRRGTVLDGSQAGWSINAAGRLRIAANDGKPEKSLANAGNGCAAVAGKMECWLTAI